MFLKVIRHSCARHKLIRFRLFSEQLHEKRFASAVIYRRLGRELGLPHFEIEDIINADISNEFNKVDQFDNNIWCMNEAVRLIQGNNRYLAKHEYKYCINLMNALNLNVVQFDTLLKKQAEENTVQVKMELNIAKLVKSRLMT